MSKLAGKEQEVIEKYKNGTSGIVIAKQFGVGRQTIYRLLQKNQVYVKDNRESKNVMYADDTLLDDTTRSNINGWLLGDGSLYKTTTPQTNFTLTTIHQEYVKYVKEIIENDNIRCNIIEDKRDKYTDKAYIVYSKRIKIFKKMYNEWYKNGVKIVPHNLELDQISIRNWIMDDGSLDKNHGTLHIYTCSFSKDDIHRLIQKMKSIIGNHHISCVSSGKYDYMYVSKKAVNALLNYIGSCPVGCFNYKWKVDIMKA